MHERPARGLARAIAPRQARGLHCVENRILAGRAQEQHGLAEAVAGEGRAVDVGVDVVAVVLKPHAADRLTAVHGGVRGLLLRYDRVGDRISDRLRILPDPRGHALLLEPRHDPFGGGQQRGIEHRHHQLGLAGQEPSHGGRIANRRAGGHACLGHLARLHFHRQRRTAPIEQLPRLRPVVAGLLKQAGRQLLGQDAVGAGGAVEREKRRALRRAQSQLHGHHGLE